MRRNNKKLVTLLVVVGVIVVLDLATKFVVLRTIEPYEHIDVFGSFVRLTYIRNPGAAFGINLGPHSREIFMALSVLALAILATMYWYTPAADRVRLLAIALICGGALGNLVDRLRSVVGVVDFVDVGLGDLRWPVFNVADMAVTTGAIVLALSLWQEDRRVERKR